MKKLLGLFTATIFAVPALSDAASFAERVISYDAGTGAGTLTNANAALGSPGPIVGPGSGFDSVFSPFNPHFEPAEIVRIGAGGHLALQLSRFVVIDRSAGVLELGIWENVGLGDAAYPTGTAGNPAFVFGEDRAIVEVSADAATWFVLNNGAPILFTLPGNYYTNSGPYDSMPPTNPMAADFGKPFKGNLSSFDGKNYSQVLNVLDGSAGGTWLDLDSIPLAQVGYLRFSVPIDGETLEIDAVSINSALTGVPVPEPAVAGLLGIALSFRMMKRLCRANGSRR